MKKVLFITSADMMKTYNNGGEHACKSNLNFLYRLYGKENVDILYFTEYIGKLPEHQYAFRRLRRWRAAFAQILGYKMYYPWDEKKILKLISKISADIIFFDGALTGTLIAKLPAETFKIVYATNCEKKYYGLKMKHEGIIHAIEYFCVKKNEKAAMDRSDCLICISKRDANDIYHFYGRRADVILPISFKDRYDVNKIKNQEYGKELLFVGSNFGPNYEGIKWFVDNVMTQLKEFKLYIVGKDFENNRDDLQKDNVTVIGSVDNLDEYYYRYPMLVMPILYGAGMKVKTAEAMMFGRTILATDEALEGYDVENIKGIYRCNSAEEFADCIKSLTNEGLPYVQEDVRHLFMEKYSQEAAYKILKTVLPEQE